MHLVNKPILCHIYRVKDNVYEKHDLDQVVPLQIPVIVWNYD